MPSPFTHRVKQITFGLLIATIVVYAADLVIWHVRELHGTGYASLTVRHIVVAPLKGNKVEYYSEGSEEVRCSQSLFGHGDASGGPCWWLAQHQQVQR